MIPPVEVPFVEALALPTVYPKALKPRMVLVATATLPAA